MVQPNSGSEDDSPDEKIIGSVNSNGVEVSAQLFLVKLQLQCNKPGATKLLGASDERSSHPTSPGKSK